MSRRLAQTNFVRKTFFLLRYGLRGYTVRFPVWATDLCLLRNVQTGSGLHPAFYYVGTGVHSRGEKWPGSFATHSLPCNA